MFFWQVIRIFDFLSLSADSRYLQSEPLKGAKENTKECKSYEGRVHKGPHKGTYIKENVEQQKKILEGVKANVSDIFALIQKFQDNFFNLFNQSAFTFYTS